MNRFTLVLVLFALLFPPACDAPGQAEIRAVEKWNNYVYLHNELQPQFLRPLEYYSAAFGRTAEYRPPAGPHDVENFISSFPPDKKFMKAIKTTLAAARDEEDELDRTAGDMLARLFELHQLLAQARAFHAGRAREDLAQAAGLHAGIQAARAKFEPAHYEFSRLLRKKDGERRKTDMAAMTHKGQSTRAAMLRAVDAAQNMQDYLARRLSPERILSRDPGDFLELLREYERAGEAFLLLDPAVEELRREDLTRESLGDFRGALTELSKRARPIMVKYERVQAGETIEPTKVDDIKTLSVSIEQLVDSYNFITE